MMSNPQRTVLGVGLVLAVASLSSANPVTVNFTGQVTFSQYDGIPVGSLVTGSYGYDDATAPASVSTDPDHASYDIDLFTLAFVDGSTIFSLNPQLAITDADPGDFAPDSYSVHQYSGPFIATGSFADVPLLTPAFYRRNLTRTAVSDFPAIPSPADVLALFPDDGSVVLGDFYGPPYTRDLYFCVTDLSVESPAVPVPGAGLLGVIGLACTGWRLRRQPRL